MNRRTTLMLALATIMFVTTGTVTAAQMGTAFTYQGHLTDDGAPGDDEYDFQFRLCRNSACDDPADPIGVVAVENHPVESGLFTVNLDFGDDAFTGEARWLELGVRPGDSAPEDPYEILDPRQELTPTPHALALPGLWTQQNETSPNLIGGYSGNTVSEEVVGATIGGGGDSTDPNLVGADFGTVGGGSGNAASLTATVGGGQDNNASGAGATVGGGWGNTAEAIWGTVGGGDNNTASGGFFATVGGGCSNAAEGFAATIGGGYYNSATGNLATIAGGGKRSPGDPVTGNRVTDDYGTIGGGGDNEAGDDDGDTTNATFATVPGGLSNTASGAYTFAAGRRAKANHDGAFVWGDSTDADFASTGADQFLIRATGGVGIGTPSPAEQLDVEGNIHASGTITSGSSITIDGTTDRITSTGDLELHVSSGRALRIQATGVEESPNLIGGYSGNSVTVGMLGATIGGGGAVDSENRVTDHCGTIAGGVGNIAGWFATISGGNDNAASGLVATIGGGYDNTASGWLAAIAGGGGNTASGSGCAVGGGASNTASTIYGTVGGGCCNQATADYATIAGGGPSDPEDEASANRVTDDYGTIGGGGNNQAGDDDGITTDAPYATVSGGEGNQATDNHATIAGGQNNTSSAAKAAVAGGNNNVASAVSAVVSGGEDNIADGVGAVVSGGFRNQALGIDSTVGGGSDNVTIGNLSTAGGGRYNTTSGFVSTVPGGIWNDAVGDYSFAAGRSAKADHHGMFVWADSDNAGPTDEDFPSATEPNFTPGPDQFLARARGGVVFVSAIDPVTGDSTAGVQLPAGGGSWQSLSDRAAKANVEPVRGREILERLSGIPVSTWNYKSQDPSIRHIGPMAQDFHAAFGVGEDERHLTTIDADGVALAAIQGLYEIVKEKDAKIAAMETRLAALEKLVKQADTGREGGGR